MNTRTHPERLVQRTAALAAPLAVESVEDALAFSAIRVGNQVLLAPLDACRAVFEIRALTPIPLAPPHFLGLCFADGRVFTLIDTADFLHLRHVNGADLNYGLVLQHGRRVIALGAHALCGIESHSASALSPIAQKLSCVQAAIDSSLVLDVPSLFADPRLNVTTAHNHG